MFDPPFNVPPLFAQLPLTEMLPASVAVPPELICTFGNVMAAVGVIVELPVNTAFEPAAQVTAAVCTV